MWQMKKITRYNINVSVYKMLTLSHNARYGIMQISRHIDTRNKMGSPWKIKMSQVHIDLYSKL